MFIRLKNKRIESDYTIDAIIFDLYKSIILQD